MAITAGRLPGELFHTQLKLEPDGRTEMTAKTLFAVTAAATIVTFAAGWAVSGTQAQVAAPSVQIEPFKLMTSAKLPTDRFTDYSIIFN